MFVARACQYQLVLGLIQYSILTIEYFNIQLEQKLIFVFFFVFLNSSIKTDLLFLIIFSTSIPRKQMYW